MSLIGSFGTAKSDSEVPSIKKFIAPRYPPIARFAGIQGNVQVALTLADDCSFRAVKVNGGADVLQSAIERSIRNPEVGLAFQSCSAEKARQLRLVFEFTLEGAPTNKWAPTYVQVNDSPDGYEIEIRTNPGDLSKFGLTRKQGQ